MIEASLARFVIVAVAVLDVVGTIWFFSSLGSLGPVGVVLSLLGFGYGFATVKYQDDRWHKLYLALLGLAVFCSGAFIVNEFTLSGVNWIVIGVRLLQIYCFVSLLTESVQSHGVQSDKR